MSRPSGRLVALAVGRLSLEKAHDVLIDAVDLVRRRGLDLDCWIAGIGPREAPLRDAVARLGLNAHVRLLGYVESIEALLNAADVFVLPSLSEGFCNALVEAMRARRPVVASDLPVIRDEIVRDSGAAVLCEPGSATSLAEGLMTLAGDGPLRACMGLAGGHAAEVFSRDAMLDGTRRLYELAVRLDHDHAAA